MFTEYMLLLVGAVLVNNFVLVQFLGLCPFMGVSTQLGSALGLSAATVFVLTLASFLSHVVYHYLLDPLGLGYLRLVAFILVIAGTVQLTELYVRKSQPLLYKVLGMFLPLITTNCAVLGMTLLALNQRLDLAQSVLYGIGAASGFALALILFTAMRERLALADVPKPFRGGAIGMVTAGLAALAFMGFSGLV